MLPVYFLPLIFILSLTFISLTSLLQLEGETTLLNRLFDQQMGQRDNRDLTALAGGFNPLNETVRRMMNESQRQDITLKQRLEEIAHATRELEQSAYQLAGNSEHHSLAA